MLILVLQTKAIQRFVISEKACFKLGEGPSRGLLRDYKPSDDFLKH